MLNTKKESIPALFTVYHCWPQAVKQGKTRYQIPGLVISSRLGYLDDRAESFVPDILCCMKHFTMFPSAHNGHLFPHSTPGCGFLWVALHVVSFILSLRVEATYYLKALFSSCGLFPPPFFSRNIFTSATPYRTNQ